MSERPTVFVVDDDVSVRKGLKRLLEAGGHTVETYASAESFLQAFDAGRRGCLLLDMQMPGMSGAELQAVLAERRARLPIVFLSAHGTVSTSVRAVKAGALDFLEKPAEGRLVLERVTAALAADSERRREAARRASARARWEDLTPREQEIAPLLAHGHSNKEIARALGISHRTVEVHRARIMHKLGVKAAFDVAEILRACGLLPPPGDPSRRPLER